MFDSLLVGGDLRSIALTLYTDSCVVRGTIRSRQRRITDMLNLAEEPFLVVSGVTIDDYGASSVATRSEYAQVNLATVLFAVSNDPIEARPDLRTPKVPEMAMITIPPFRITGRIHLLPERELHEALSELTGAFFPVTEATFWSDTVGEARATAQLLAVNHNRAHILAPHTEVDPWHGLDRSAAAGGPIESEDTLIGEEPSDAPGGGWG